MGASKGTSNSTWVDEWLEAVRNGTGVMSQRTFNRLKGVSGGVAAVRRLAKKNGVHLLLLTDEKGVDLVAASTRPFKILC